MRKFPLESRPILCKFTIENYYVRCQVQFMMIFDFFSSKADRHT